MKTDKLNYALPRELIAQKPAGRRSDSRLLVHFRNGNKLVDSRFCNLSEYLAGGDCLVLNDTKVLPARFFAKRATGAKLEGLFLSERDKGIWKIFLKGAGKVKESESILIKDTKKGIFCPAEIIEKRIDGLCILKLETKLPASEVLDKIGFPPLPPYIKRGDDLESAAMDKLRYQTVYARSPGAIAAPTAGLHFTKELIKKLKELPIYFAYITLHVGTGTFRPVTEEMLEDHQIHQEDFSIDERNAGIINDVRGKGGRIIAVGTTSVRALESASEDSRLKAACGKTSLFIRPGYQFKIVDGMITNFHLPNQRFLRS